MFNNNDQQHQPLPRRDQPPQQQNQRQFRQGGQNNYQPQLNYYEGGYYEQFPSPPRVTGGRRSSSQPQQGQQAYLGQQNTTNLSGEYSWMNANRTINRPTISRLTGAGGGGVDATSILSPPPGLGQGTTGRGSSMSLAEDPPAINSTFQRGVRGANLWSGGGGAFGAPRTASGASLHSGGPYRGPTPPTPGSSLGQPSYHQQDPQGYDYSGGNAFTAPYYIQQSMVGTSLHQRGRQACEPEPEPSRAALPSSFMPAPPTSRLARQQPAGSNFVEVQEVPTSCDQSPCGFGIGGEEDLIPPPFRSVQPSNQQLGYQYPSQYEPGGPMGSIGEHNSNHPSHVQHPSSPSQRSLSRNSDRSQRSSGTSSPSRGGRGRARGRGKGGGGRGGGGREGGGRGSRPSSRSSSRGSLDDRPFSSVTIDSPGRHSATLRPPSPTAPELEALNQSLGRPDSASGRNSSRGSQSSRNRPGSAGSNTSRGSQSPRNRPGSAGSNTSRGSQSPRNRPGSAKSNSSDGRRSADSRNSNTSGTETPNPQNLRGDPFRNSKVKTELCRNYMAKGICQYGDKCNYAHGKDDLKFQTLLELDNGGVTDVETYRTRVCFTWVATGSCPFEQRCGGLHDPRIIGPEKHWLPHAEMDHNCVLTGRNVDKCHHQRLASIYNCSPIYGYVPPARWKEGGVETLAAWKHFYSYICNISPHPTPDSQEPTELARVYMAIKIREGRGGQVYSYLPTHCLHDSPSELCMVLQRKIFAVPKRAAITSNNILDITGDETYINDPRKSEKYHLHSAHLIAFGPMGDPESRDLSVFYDLKTSDIRECTPQESKRYKRSRHLIKPSGDRDGGRTPKIEEISTESYRQQQSLLSLRLAINENRRDIDDLPHFYNYQPVDNDTYDLITDILKHRVRYLDSKVVLPQDSGSTTRKELRIQQDEEDLKRRFESLRRHWMTWSWPVRSGVDKIDRTTPIPDADGEYYFGLEDPTNFQIEIFFGVDKDPGKPDIVSNPMTKAAVGFLWESFLMNCRIILGKNPNLRLNVSRSESKENKLSAEALASVNRMYTNLRRLPIFRLLSLEVRASDHNEIMELPLISPRKRTPSPDVSELSLLSPRRTPSPQSIPDDIMETFFVEWDELIVHTKNNGPFNQAEEEEENEEDEEEEQVETEVEEEIQNMASPVAINDDHIIAYLYSAATKGTRSIAENTNQS